MLHITAPRRPLSRAVALLLATLLASAGLSLGASSAARAASDGAVTVDVGAVSVSVDANGNGRFDVGDEARVTMTFTAGPHDVTNMKVQTNLGYFVISDTLAGARRTVSLLLPIVAANVNDAGQGPVNTFWTLEYTADGASGSLPIESAPLAPTSSPLLLDPTTVSYTEHYGSVANAAVEGDTVSYSTRVTNDTGVTMTITDPGGAYGGTTFPVTLGAGASTTLTSAPRAVTYADMLAGSIAWPQATIGWATPDASGTVAATIPSAAVEAVDASVDASITTTVHTSGGAPVALGDAVAGDVIDYAFHVTNTGNVTQTRLFMGAGQFPGTSISYGTSSSSVGLQPGASIPAGPYSAADITSRDGRFFHPYELTAADVTRGYVDIPFRVVLAPSFDAYDASPATYTYDLPQRVFLRSFTTGATLDVTPVLADANGDGKGQAGETVTFNWTLTNTSDQDLTLTNFADNAAADVPITTGAYDGTTVARGGTAHGSFAYTLTPADQTRGSVAVRPEASITGKADGATATAPASASVTTGAYVAPPISTGWSLTNDDENGDGKLNAGDTLHITFTLKNAGTYPLTGITVSRTTDTVPLAFTPAFPGSLAGGASEKRSFEHVVTAAEEAAGRASFVVSINADGRSVPLGAGYYVSLQQYVAPATEFTADATYDDANGDGQPSIGETAHVEVTLENTGSYPLTGIVLDDAPGADVTGLLPSFPASSLAAGAHGSVAFDYVLTAADFARGTFSYGAQLSADGLASPALSTVATLEPVGFETYVADLDAVGEGGVVVCDASGTAVTGVTIGEKYTVKPVSCNADADPTGYRVVAYSSPLTLAVDSFGVKVPGALGIGAHRFALYAPDGTLVGWRAVTASDPVALAFTGYDGGGLVALAAALLLAGVGAVVFAARRRGEG